LSSEEILFTNFFSSSENWFEVQAEKNAHREKVSSILRGWSIFKDKVFEGRQKNKSLQTVQFEGLGMDE
jgi:hypothetical protein